MGRKYTPEQEINNLRSKGKITHQEAGRRVRALKAEQLAEEAEQVAEEAKASSGIRGAFRRVRNFFSK
jgi:hypothetical protein